MSKQQNFGGLSGFRPEIPLEEKIQELVEKLQIRHGNIRVSHESSGMHLNMACPKCLEQYGRRELKSRHLAFNVDKYFRTGKWAPKIGVPDKRKGYAQCMKEHGSFSAVQLLDYAPLVDRGFPDVVFGKVNLDKRESTYVDSLGREVPLPPGKLVPVDQLPHDHQCMEFIRDRDYDPVLLRQQFNAAFCEAGRHEEAEEYTSVSKEFWRNTYQGRLIFESRIQESVVAWQARVPQIGDLFLHPYTGEWVTVQDPIRYMTGKGSMRNRQLCGYDAAVRNREPQNPVVVLTEGPLDAARFPHHGLAVLGKYLSREQALLISLYWRRAILAFDAGGDAAGAELSQQAVEMLASVGVIARDFWTGSKYDREQITLGQSEKVDCGELGYAWCREQFERVKNF